ncbi:MAG: chitobiase/beta-hexosaminidase C-terminal domain-containing protein [Bacteroidales bacterium]|nr:chitobiase/beta-hexosaminidase C-terminal domain-containing protein [Bacteroidales bacterium]
MKRIIIIAMLLIGISAVAQKNIVDIGVIPTPQQVEIIGGSVSLGKSSPIRNFVTEIEGASNQRQAYRLDITPTGVRVTCTSNEGWDYALRTLNQLKKIYRGEVPCMTITDWPAYEYRGWLDDISRGPIPNRQFRRQTRSFAEQYKMNFGNYYTEHTLYNEQYPDISGNSGISDIEFANDPYMMANLQCFAHFEKTLRIPFYQSLMDSPTNVNPSKEETYAFLRDQIENAVQAYYSSHFFNINCDETEGLGSGRARQYVDERGADEVYCQHINRVYNLIQNAYRETHDSGEKMDVLMWGDIVGKNPEMLKKLPKEMQYIVWSYGAEESYSNMIAPFAKIHREQGNAFWVAPGVSHWSSAPQVRNYMQNIAYLARDGYLAGARGLMNTAWDDSGESLFGDCWHAMAWGAEMAWHPITATNPKKAREEMAMRERIFNKNYSRLTTLEYETNTGMTPAFANRTLTDMIYSVGDLVGNKWIGDWFYTRELMQPLMDFYPANVDPSILTRCDSVDRLVNEVLKGLDSSLVPHFAYACHRLLRVSEKNRLRVLLYRTLTEEPGKAPSKLQIQDYCRQYFHNLHSLKLEYLRLWDEECTDYSRDIICARYDQLGQEVQQARQKVFISNSYKDGKMYVTLKTLFTDRPIYFTVDGRKPTQGANLYKRPFTIGRSCIVKAVSYNKWDEPVYSEQYLLFHKGIGNITRLNTPYSDYRPMYSGGGDNALADGILGSDVTYDDGHWQGYWGKDIDVEYDLMNSTQVKTITLRFLQNANDWILSPQVIEVYTSADGSSWKCVRTEHYKPEFREQGTLIRTLAIRDLKINSRHLRVVVKNPGKLPAWHPGHGSDSYLFCDEIVIE